ncbi:MAG: hypothetical protein ABL962_13780 [Fimbriimonadaceae bacterium]
MPIVNLPINISYETRGTTPIRDVVAALQATDGLVQDAVALLPSLLGGADVRLISLSVQQLTQQSPLREILIAAVFIAAQDALEDGVVAAVEALSGQELPSDYYTLLTVIVLVVLFYGVGLARDVLGGAVSEGPAKRQLNAMIDDLSQRTGRPGEEVKRILDAKYDKPGPVRSLVRNALSFFIPSKREGNAGISVGDIRIEPRIVDDVPFADQLSDEQDFERFKPYDGATLELHAQDIDKSKTGWAAVPKGISRKRLRLRLMPPVEPSALWGKSRVVGDIVIISKATAGGFVPTEIHLTSIIAAE